MARDPNPILHDGTNFTATITPNSLTRSGGSAVLDIGKTGIEGLWVQLALTASLTGTSATIDVKLQSSSSSTFASDIEDLGAFQQLVQATSLTPLRVEKQITTKRRYLRAVLTVGGTLSTETLLVHVVSGPNRTRHTAHRLIERATDLTKIIPSGDEPEGKR